MTDDKKDIKAPAGFVFNAQGDLIKESNLNTIFLN